MAKVDKNKIGALVDKHAAKKAPPKGGKQQPPGKHAQEEAKHEGGSPEHEQQEHDDGDREIAEQQAQRVANGNGDDELDAIVGESEHEDGERPEWASDEEIWNRAEKACAGLPDVDEDHKLLVIAHTYEALGGEIEGKGGDGEDDGEDGEVSSDDYEEEDPGDEPG